MKKLYCQGIMTVNEGGDMNAAMETTLECWASSDRPPAKGRLIDDPKELDE